MRTRQEIKAIGKEQFKLNYWNCVLAALLVTAVMGVVTWMTNGEEIVQMVNGQPGQATITVRSNAGGLLALLLGGPIAVGLNYFFVKNVQGEREELSVTTPFTEAFKNYPRKLGGSLWMGLFVFLWALLLVIPGIIKGISYSMTQYLLADCPNVKARDALKLSMRMMNGHKWEYFVMGLSFLGWILLSALTLGILSVFYVDPYMRSSFAEYYLELRDEALRTGVITQGQLDGTELV
ncbi:MAG: DUF975 family protein [Oscillospiraceae bacterium]|nr:DUF975 family protein [Oscillospiraceae bacterium]